MSRATTFVPAILLGAGVLLISGMREQFATPPVAPMNTIPSTFDGLPGKSLEVPAEERRVAAMSDYSLRQFGAEAAPLFTVYVGYYDRQVQGRTIHSPRNCLPGAGWEILTASRLPMPGDPATGSVNRVLLANRRTRALVYYWYQGRGRSEANEYTVKWNLLHDAVLYGRTEESLVRIVVPVASPRASSQVPGLNDAEVKAADAIAVRVAAELRPAVDKVMPAAPGS
ncbi:MAG: exosortase C-terminal domain/associated protein EpsI [Gemmatimonadaceae bacterium]